MASRECEVLATSEVAWCPAQFDWVSFSSSSRRLECVRATLTRHLHLHLHLHLQDAKRLLASNAAAGKEGTECKGQGGWPAR